MRLLHSFALERRIKKAISLSGPEVVTTFGIGDAWIQVDEHPGDIVCIMGDLLMSYQTTDSNRHFNE